MWYDSPICLQLERHDAARPLSRAWAKTGKRIAARMAIMAITTSSSIKVKPRCRDGRCDMALSLKNSKPAVETTGCSGETRRRGLNGTADEHGWVPVSAW